MLPYQTIMNIIEENQSVSNVKRNEILTVVRWLLIYV